MPTQRYPAQCINTIQRNATQCNGGRQNFFNEFHETFSSILYQKGDVTIFSGNLFVLFAFCSKWDEPKHSATQDNAEGVHLVSDDSSSKHTQFFWDYSI